MTIEQAEEFESLVNKTGFSKSTLVKLALDEYKKNIEGQKKA